MSFRRLIPLSFTFSSSVLSSFIVSQVAFSHLLRVTVKPLRFSSPLSFFPSLFFEEEVNGVMQKEEEEGEGEKRCFSRASIKRHLRATETAE